MKNVTIAGNENIVHVTYDGLLPGDERWVMLSSDRHHDNIFSRWDLEREDLEMAIKREALIVDVGDLFCAMQGKWDPRSSMDDIRPEHVGANYLDLITRDAGQFYRSAAPNMCLLSKGNHETNILNRHGVDLVQNLAYLLRTEHGSQVCAGGYGGWVHFDFKRGDGGPKRTVRLKYHHGSGGGGPVTRGVIQTNRQAVYLPDADIVANGHTHDLWYVPIARERLTKEGTPTRDIVHFVRTGTYKDEYQNGDRGYQVEKWSPPKPLGCAWIHFTMGVFGNIQVGIEITVR